MLCAKTLKAAKAALIIILGAWATLSAHAQMNLSGGTHAPAVYAAETVSTKAFTALVATNTTFTVTAWSDVTLATGTYHFRYDLTGDTGSAVFGSDAMFRIGGLLADGSEDLTPDLRFEEPVRARPNSLVFTAEATADNGNDLDTDGNTGFGGTNAAGDILRSTPPAKAGDMPKRGTDLVLKLDGAHPTDENDAPLLSKIRAAKVTVKGAPSSGTYKFFLRLRIYKEFVGALNGTNTALYDSGPKAIIAIDPTLSATVKASDDLVADVLHNFAKFQDGTKGSMSGELAMVTLALKDKHCSEYKPGVVPAECAHMEWDIMPAGDGGDAQRVEIGDVLGSGSSLTVTGDLSLVNLKLGAKALTLRDGTAKPLEMYTEGDNKGQYKDRSLAADAHTALTAAGAMSLTANVGAKNTSAIPESSYAATVALMPKNADAAPVAGVSAAPAGVITSNGTMVHMGYLTGHDGYNQRVIIANRGTVDAQYVVANILTEDGTVATAGKDAKGMVPASSQIVLRAADIISFDSGMTRASATISLTAPANAISVSSTIVNLGDGSTDTTSHMAQ